MRLPTEVDGHPIRDLIDWRWWTDQARFCVSYADGSTEEVERDPQTGLLPARFEQLPPIFDQVRHCVNDCNFCFVKQLPPGMRDSLYVKDDDYRLSFLEGNFATLSNLSEADLERIVEMSLSPLYVSLHSLDPDLRQTMLGQNAARGLANLKRLLAAGITFHLQVVLVPGYNDGADLEQTMAWAEQQTGALSLGVVPFGYTRWSKLAKEAGVTRPKRVSGCGLAENDQVKTALQIIRQAQPFAKTMLADEFFLKAYGAAATDKLPPAAYYHNYCQYENGIGMLRYWLDQQQLTDDDGDSILYITGEAFAGILKRYHKRVLAVRNDFFGGNVNVAGLLTGQDVIAQARPVLAAESADTLVLPAQMFNDDGLTLDGMSLAEISQALAVSVELANEG
ncbi:MAG: DUF512 domain-containing protein [Coriobacteriales bacterium]|jgi:putative radical SAM enzyme (TIGR03279 family)|nr:DUF512 domain-containing protein [Coriobacteriales bacterium]